MTTSKELREYLDNFLKIKDFPDHSQNGLQVEGDHEIKKIALAVDARLQTFALAEKEQAQLLICHHGLFWGRSERLVGHHYKRVKLLIENNIGLYAAHIPLDAHLTVGNNAVFGQKLGLVEQESWSQYKGKTIGIRGQLKAPKQISEFKKDIEDILHPVDGNVHIFGKGPELIQHVGIVTGDAANELSCASQNGLDALITGEPDHISSILAEELGIHLICGGHYATETFGVKALGAHLKKTFRLDTVFLHVPSYA